MNYISIHILKLCKNALSPFLAQIFIHCTRKGTYPKSFCNNYRAILLLSPMKKIFENLLYSCLYSYIEQHNMLSTNQYGFRSGLSTSLGVYDMHENFLQNTNKGLTTCAVFCDLSKAFDVLDHEKLLWKLEHLYGIRGLPHKLLTSYLQEGSNILLLGGIGQLPGR